ncbi:MAG: amidohydrolase family protein [Acidobacteriota bacterium]
MTRTPRVPVGLAVALAVAAAPTPSASSTGAAHAGAQSAQPAVVAFTNVTVIPMDRERAIADQTVIVRGDRIAEVGPAARVQVPAGATRIDGRGKFLMPGVAEMHAHIPGGQAPQALVDRVLGLFVANGVTTIRGMLGDPRHLPLRDQAARGEIVSPTVYTSGPSFNGNSVTSVEAGVKMVRDQKAAGYDFLKIHPGVPRAAFDAVAAEARALKLPFAGHVPADVGLMRALEARYASIDHLDGYLEYAVRDDAPVDKANPGFFGVNFAMHLDPAKLRKAVADTKAAGVWIVPTQGLLELFFRPDSPEQMKALPGVEYMPPEIVAGWVKQRTAFLATMPERAVVDRFLDERRTLLRALHDAGVDIVLGSDAIQTFSVPGFSLFNEMAAMARAGMTPYQIYVTGTRNVARYFGVDHELGTVEAGKRADLVLVDADPLRDVANFARQTGTMVRGRWYARAELLKSFTQPGSAPAGGAQPGSSQPPPPQAAATPPPTPDCSAPVYRQFDFWLGEWDVVPNGVTLAPGQKPSSNVITSAHGGCVLVENWRAASGGTGTSLNIYDRSRGQWHQTWTDSSGGLHEYWGRLENGNMVFHGTMPVPTSPQLRMNVRLTFFHETSDRVRQLSERLNADGSWTVNYDLIYTRRGAH